MKIHQEEDAASLGLNEKTQLPDAEGGSIAAAAIENKSSDSPIAAAVPPANGPTPQSAIDPPNGDSLASLLATVAPLVEGSSRGVSPSSSGDTESEEASLKTRAAASAKASAARDAAAREALLNPQRDSGGRKLRGATPIAMQHEFHATNDRTQQSSVYYSSILRVQSTIQALQMKSSRGHGLISANDLYVLHNQFDAMLKHHPIYSPEAQRKQQYAIADTINNFNRMKMEERQKEELLRRVQQQTLQLSSGHGGSSGGRRGVHQKAADSVPVHLSAWQKLFAPSSSLAKPPTQIPDKWGNGGVAGGSSSPQRNPSAPPPAASAPAGPRGFYDSHQHQSITQQSYDSRMGYGNGSDAAMLQATGNWSNTLNNTSSERGGGQMCRARFAVRFGGVNASAARF